MPSVARGRPEPDPSPPAAPPPGVALPAALEQRRRVLAVVLDVARLALAALVGGQAAGVPLAVLEVEVRDVPLALQAAADALDDFPDGVWLVPLASISDPDLAARAIWATALRTSPLERGEVGLAPSSAADELGRGPSPAAMCLQLTGATSGRIVQQRYQSTTRERTRLKDACLRDRKPKHAGGLRGGWGRKSPDAGQPTGRASGSP